MNWDSQKSFWMRMNKCAPEHKDSAYPYQKKKNGHTRTWRSLSHNYSLKDTDVIQRLHTLILRKDRAGYISIRD